jgi:hypothetical protein
VRNVDSITFARVVSTFRTYAVLNVNAAVRSAARLTKCTAAKPAALKCPQLMFVRAA